jgi:hypothetical protein
MANYNVSVTQSIEAQPANIAAGESTTYVISNPLSATSYFTLETARNGNGFYDSTSPKNTSGSFTLGTGITSLIQSDYIAGVMVQPGGGNLTFVPAVNITNSTLYLRGVGSNEGVAFPPVPPQIPLDPDAAAYIETANFTNPDLIEIINDFYISLKATGFYSRLTHMKLNLTDSTNNTTALFQCSINGINPLVGQTIYTNNPTANYSGVQYNGINQSSRLSYNPGTDPNLSLENTSLLSYVYSTAFAWLSWAQRNAGGFGVENIGLTIVNNGVTQNFINDQASIVTFSELNTASGFNGASRKNVAGIKYHFKNSTSITETGIFTTGRANLNIVEGGRTLDNTTISDVYDMRAQFVAFGQGFTVEEMAIIEPIINNLQESVDTLFGLTGTSARKRY